jgi:hypothetical protein
MADWRMARSLEQLRSQLNELAPNRSRISDGGIGDAAHQTRASDHNPRWFSWADQQLVTARDFTHDPDGGLDCQRLYLTLVGSHDPRIKYLIWRRTITYGAGGPTPWVARPYTGANPHEKHLHVSVVDDQRADSVTLWRVQPTPTPKPGGLPVLRLGDRSDAVLRLQEFLVRSFPSYAQFIPTGYYGEQTRAAVREFQRRAGVQGNPLDGTIVGAATNAALAEHGYRG